MDEYERALRELQEIVHSLSIDDYLRVSNPSSPDPDCLSVQTILRHTILAGFGYANHIRKAIGGATHHHEITSLSQTEAFMKLDQMFQYTLETMDGHWEMDEEKMLNTVFKTSWSEYDIESMIEHAIVHILRHRRQIQKLVGTS